MMATYRATTVWNPASRAPRLAPPYFDSVVSLLPVKFWFLGTWSTHRFSRRRMHFKANETALSYLFRELFIPQGVEGAFSAFISTPRTKVLIPSIASNGVHSLHGVFGTNKIPFARFLVLRKSREFCSAWIVNGYFLRLTWSS